MSQCGYNLFSSVPLGTYQQWWKWRVFTQGTLDCITIKLFAYWKHRGILGWHFSKFHYPNLPHSVRVPTIPKGWRGNSGAIFLLNIFTVANEEYRWMTLNERTEGWRDRWMERRTQLFINRAKLYGSLGETI